MVISCFSFTEVAKRAVPMMPNGGSLLTLTYGGAHALGALLQRHGRGEGGAGGVACAISRPTSGPLGIRVNALSAGPMRTLAGAGISDARVLFNYQRDHAPLRRTPTLDEVGGAGLYLLSDLVGRGDGRGALRRLRLQHRRHAEPGVPEDDRAGRASLPGRTPKAGVACPTTSAKHVELHEPRRRGISSP